jgi:hypothetical protein
MRRSPQIAKRLPPQRDFQRKAFIKEKLSSKKSFHQRKAFIKEKLSAK